MYHERMFDSWKQGLLYFALVIALPIIPIIIYMFDESADNNYLYVLLLAVVASFLYEFMNVSSGRCSTFLKVESVICSVSLSVMLIWDVYSLLFTYSSKNSVGVGTGDYVLVSLFVFPVVVVIIEIVRSIIHDITLNKYPPAENNLTKGAATL